MKSIRYLFLSLMVSLAAAIPVVACGPFIFTVQEQAPISLIDPQMAETPQWLEFFGYASPPIGLQRIVAPNSAYPGQPIIQTAHLGIFVAHLDNLVYDTEEDGNNGRVHDANIQEWQAFCLASFGKKLTMVECSTMVDKGQIPSWVDAASKRYLQYLQKPALDTPALVKLAQDKTLPAFLKTRWAFQAIRQEAVVEAGNSAPGLFQQLEPTMDHHSLSYFRALAYQARQKPHLAALEDYLNVFENQPALRSQVFLTFMNDFESKDFQAIANDQTKPAAVRISANFVEFLVGGRDFSAGTLARMVKLDQGGSRSRFMMVRMLEQIELEAGNQSFEPLFGEKLAPAKTGLYSPLVNVAIETGKASISETDKAFWLECAAYLSLFDGKLDQMAQFLNQSQGLKASPRTADFRVLLGLLVDFSKTAGQAMPIALQNRYQAALALAFSRTNLGENRGLYQSLSILLVQKYLSLGQLDQAALAFNLLADHSYNNPYDMSYDDYFWGSSLPGASSYNFLVDVLMGPDDLQAWKRSLSAKPESNLQAMLVKKSQFNSQDLDYLTAIKNLRRGDYEQAIPLVASLDKAGFFKGKDTFRSDRSLLPAKKFFYSTKASVWKPETPPDLKQISLVTLTGKLLDIKTRLKSLSTEKIGLADSQFLLESAAVYFNLQVTGFPLVFSKAPPLIHFVDDFDFYPYQGMEQTSLLAEFPLSILPKTTAWADRESKFNQIELNPVHAAQILLTEVAKSKVDPDQEILALGLLVSLDPKHSSDWKRQTQDERFAKTELLAKLKATCEGY